MRAVEFLLLVEGYKEATADFSKSESPAMVDSVITRYKDLVNRNQVQGQERNIDYWRKQGWIAFRTFVDKKGSKASRTQVKRKKVVGNSVFLREDDQWLIVIPLDKNASCFYGKNSSWCTTKPEHNYFERYFYQNDVVLVYCLNKQTGGMFAIAGHPDLSGQLELFDQRDAPISEKQFKQATGLDAQQLMREAITKYSPEITKAKGPYVATANELKKIIPTLTQRDPEIEKKLLQIKDGLMINNYVIRTLPGVSTGQAEMPADFPMALTLPLISYNPQVLQSIPNPTEQQQFAAVDTLWGGRYVTNPTPRVIDRALSRHGSNLQYFLVDYDTIIKYPKAAAYWAFKNGRRVPEAEQAILNDPEALYYYTGVKVDQPWPAAEQAILANKNINPDIIVRYAENYRQGRWPEGEKLLLEKAANDPGLAYTLSQYAIRVIHRRWPEAESIIINDPPTAAEYAIALMKNRWKEAEPGMLEVNPESDESESIQKYFDEHMLDTYRYEWQDYFGTSDDY